MHTLLGLSSMLLVLLGGYLVLSRLRHLGDWSRRRDLQFLVLATPVVSLALGIGGLHHFAGQICFLDAPPWDSTLGLALPLAMGLVAIGGLAWGLIRLFLMGRVVARNGASVGPDVQALVGRLAERLGAPPPSVRLCHYDRPLALTYGISRPTILLSSWMLERLDRCELESVLAHELAHVARRDYLVTWLATVLRDAFFYLPTSWVAYRQLQREKELACDDRTVDLTNRPLALASALAKVWQQAVGGPIPEAAQALAGSDAAIEGRIERLLAPPRQPAGQPCSRLIAICLGTSALAGLLALEAAIIAVMLLPMGCSPISLLGTLI